MAYDLSVINYRTIRDPVEFILESDETYEKNVEKAAEKIADNLKQSPIVLLAGPSGSGKTTTASKYRKLLKSTVSNPTMSRWTTISSASPRE